MYRSRIRNYPALAAGNALSVAVLTVLGLLAGTMPATAASIRPASTGPAVAGLPTVDPTVAAVRTADSVVLIAPSFNADNGYVHYNTHTGSRDTATVTRKG